MALIGCNFTCQNKECKCFNTGFTLTGVWPLGDIDTVIEHCDHAELKENLIGRKKIGYKYAKINYPDPYDIPVIAQSIEKFCKTCKRIETFVIEDDDTYETPAKCEKCNGCYTSLVEACDEGNYLKCPFCDKELTQQRWYVNNGSGEELDSEDEEEEEGLL